MVQLSFLYSSPSKWINPFRRREKRVHLLCPWSCFSLITLALLRLFATPNIISAGVLRVLEWVQALLVWLDSGREVNIDFLHGRENHLCYIVLERLKLCHIIWPYLAFGEFSNLIGQKVLMNFLNRSFFL